jgi:hypothetical protein
MANLTALREKIKNITDYSPELQQFNDQLDELINDAYYQIWTHKRWNFATKLIDWPFLIDMTPRRDQDTVGAANVNAAVTEGSRLVTFSGSMDRLGEYADLWEGQPIEIQGYEYKISVVVSDSRVMLDRKFFGTTKTDDETWKIKKRWYNLPEDCLELLYIGHRDYPYISVTGTTPPYGKQTGLMPRREEEYGLRADYAMNYAEAYIPSPTENIPAGEKLEVAGSPEAITGDLTNNRYFEFCWAFLKEGKVGPLSEPKIYQNTGNDPAARLSFFAWDEQALYCKAFAETDDSPAQWEGFDKKIYFNKNLDPDTGERTGLPCWIEVVNAQTITAGRPDPDYIKPVVVPHTSTYVDVRYLSQLDNGSRRYIEVDGSHQRIRPYPRVDGFDVEIPEKFNTAVPPVKIQKHDYVKTGIMRYYKKPLDLLLPTDSPEMPYEFHQLIVYKALEIIYLKLGDASMAGVYEKKYEKAIKELEKRYVDKVDVQPIRSQFGLPRSFRGYTSSDLKHGG